MVKRKSGFHFALCQKANIELADDNARKSKKRSLKYIKRHDAHREEENNKLLEDFKKGTYETSAYTKYRIYEPKERIIYRLPYYPDRIGQHAIMNVIKGYWTKLFIPTTYSCIEGRGIHKCLHDVKRDLRKAKLQGKNMYCLKLDIVKFYPSINHAILKDIIKWKVKDNKFLPTLYSIIDSINGYADKDGVSVPIGNYLSQFFANLYLTPFDHWCKEVLKCRYYYRYADDIVILAESKERLHEIFNEIKKYLQDKLDLKVKHTYQIFSVEERGIDFVGYIIRPDYTLVRNNIKKKINRLVLDYTSGNITIEKFKSSMQSYFGWLKYSNSKHLLKIIEEKTGIKWSNFQGTKSKISLFRGKNVNIINITPHNKYYVIELVYKHRGFLVHSTDKRLYEDIKSCPNNYTL